MKPKILICDDDNKILSALRLLLKSQGFAVVKAQSPLEALVAIKQQNIALALIDLNYQRDTTSGSEGLELIEQIRRTEPELPLIIMTGWASIDIAVSAMLNGANDFVEKPWDNQRLINMINNQLALQQSRHQAACLAAENTLLKAEIQPQSWVCQSPAMQQLMALVNRVADTDINLLITGENGTGKSQLAEQIHQLSSRNKQSLVTVNMGAINEQVFESELFGHVKGAFTDAKSDRIGRFELADQGSIFLDEIGNIPLSQQAKVLRVLESGCYEKLGSSKSCQADVRIISATNANLGQMIDNKEFRQDLLYRLNSVEIHVPPLRKRIEDIELLAQQMLEKLSVKYRRQLSGFEPAALNALQDYHWPGNIRELEHQIQRAVLMAAGELITVNDLSITIAATAKESTGDDSQWQQLTLAQAELKFIEMALVRHQGNASEAAQALGLSRSAFYRRLDKLKSAQL